MLVISSFSKRYHDETILSLESLRLSISWVKNLPISIPKRFLALMMVVSLFLIPESVILIKYFPQTLPFYWMVFNLFYLISLSAFLLGFLHQKALPLEHLTKKTFWVFILLIVLILFGFPLIILSALNFTGGFLLFCRNYYLFEPYRRAAPQSPLQGI